MEHVLHRLYGVDAPGYRRGSTAGYSRIMYIYNYIPVYFPCRRVGDHQKVQDYEGMRERRFRQRSRVV